SDLCSLNQCSAPPTTAVKSPGPASHKTSVNTPPTSSGQRIGLARTAEYAAASPGINPNQIKTIINVLSPHSAGTNRAMCDESETASSPGVLSSKLTEIFTSRKIAN